MSKSRHDFSAFTLVLLSSSILSPLIPVAVASGLSPSPSPSPSPSSSSYLHRRDPFRHFKYYDGAYDVRSRDYWASAAFTGIHGFAMAGAWFAIGLGLAIAVIAKYICCGSTGNSPSIHSHFSYYFLFSILMLLSLLAMVAIGFAIAENHETVDTIKEVEEAVLGAGNEARVKIHKVNKVMNKILTLLCPYDQATCLLLNTTSNQLGKESHGIHQFMDQNGHLIDRAIWSSYIINLVVVSVNLLFLVAGLVLSLFHWHPGFIMLIFLCWISTMACWVVTGIDFFLHNFAKDTCNALEDFKQNPQNSSLSSLLPCADALKSQSFMMQIGQIVHTFITELNSNIDTIPKELGINEASYEHVVGKERTICDPFSGPPHYTYLQGKCPKNAIRIHDLPDILARFKCNESDISMETCKDYGKFLPEPTYLMANAYILSVGHLVNVYPDLEDLIHCSFVKDRVSGLVLHQCNPFREHTYALWVATLSLSIFMTTLVFIWVVKVYWDRGTSFSSCSILPREDRRQSEQPPPQQPPDYASV